MNRYGNEARGGWQAFMADPFRDSDARYSIMDIHPECLANCTWVVRNDMWTLKYRNRICSHHVA